jgi:hypothetical protein
MDYDIESVLHRLRSVYSGLPRAKDGILIYLEEVFRAAEEMRAQKRRDVLHQIHGSTHKTLDRRITKSPYRLLIELTCACNVKLKSRYANALKFARRNCWTTSRLAKSIKTHGGIERCSRAYTRQKD